MPDTPDETIDELFEKIYPHAQPNTRAAWANQVRRYVREIRIGDRVMTYDPSERTYLLGEVRSDTESREGELVRKRDVTWTHRVDRDSLSENARNKLGSIVTLFRVGTEAKE